MIGFIAGLPIKVYIHGTDITLVLIEEASRRIHMRNMLWAVYTSGTLLPKPFCQTTYYHRNLDLKKLVDAKFTYLPHNINMTKAIKCYVLPSETFVSALDLCVKKMLKMFKI